ncbi:MAG TPA: helix-turn-helix transcriptional regulator [Solirubrobacteraceae bacterium]|nr:helix-turn-helix transcriptional regulator [Solirubrobacteraceae bacterium]
MVVRGETEAGSWELVQRAPHPLLRAHVRGFYEGYQQMMCAPVRRLEVPHAGIVLIVGLGPLIDVDGACHGSFVAGLYDVPVVVRDDGRQAGIQVNLTPLGAGMLLGMPMRELTGRTVALDDLLDDALSDRLRALATWAARFAALDAFLLRRLRAAREARPDVAYAWSRLDAARGDIPIAQLCRELGCSARHLSARFGEQVGMSPKAFSRVLRFERAVSLLIDGAPPGKVSAICGFADQSHLNREFRALAGRAPGAFAASVINVQDGLGVAA